jgi:hypothetical protein
MIIYQDYIMCMYCSFYGIENVHMSIVFKNNLKLKKTPQMAYIFLATLNEQISYECITHYKYI